MSKRTFAIVSAIEIPIGFIVLTLLLNGSSDVVFYIAWAIYAAAVLSVFIFLKRIKDETKKEKIRRKIAIILFAFIIICALTIAALIAVLLFMFSSTY